MDEKKLHAFNLTPTEYGKVIKVLKHQTGKTNLMIDKTRKAMQPGKRISRTGKIYWESRKNRSDISYSKKL